MVKGINKKHKVRRIMQQQLDREKLAEPNGKVQYRKEQSHYFNCVDRANYHTTKNHNNSSSNTGPNCTRYKPKYDLVDHKQICLPATSHHPSVIEEIILARYREFQE